MIVVSMELYSAIHPSRNRSLCKVVIINDGTGTGKKGNYDWKVEGVKGQTIKKGKLLGWPREAKSPGQLLARVMQEAYGDQTKV